MNDEQTPETAPTGTGHDPDPAPHDAAPPQDPAPQDPAPQDPAPQDPAPQDPAPQDPAPQDPAPHDPVAEGLDLDVLPGGARAALEAVLMVVDEPVSELTLAATLVLPRDRVRALLEELAAEYTDEQRGFELRQVAGGWRVFSRDALAPVVQRFVLDGQTARLTQAALETLAVVAYRQPVSRARVSAIRGVNVDGVVRTLTARGLVQEVGQDPESGAVLYGTTTYFLEKMGMGGIDELPPLAPYLPEVEALDELTEGRA